MINVATLDDLKDMLLDGNIIGLPIVELKMLEKIKEHCFLSMGPLAVGIDMKQELFLLQRDPQPGGEKWH